MPLTDSDRKWLDRKFDGVHDRITESNTRNAESLAQVRMNLATHVSAPCGDVEKHEERLHGKGLKNLSILLGVILGGTAIFVAAVRFAIAVNQ